VMILELGVIMDKHGQPITGKYNFWVSLITAGIYAWLMYKGGLWS